MSKRLGVENYRKIVFLTGAGISKASGLSTYRGEGGMWERENVEEVATKRAFDADPLRVWQAFLKMHLKVLESEPSAAHLAISSLQKRLGEAAWVCVLTQNVDGLHAKAGTESVIEAHGSLRRLRCTECPRKPWDIESPLGATPPSCPDCGATSRFDVVLFDEPLDPMLGLKALAFLGDCDLYIVVGTSGLVAPASQLIHVAQEAGARTVCVNIEPNDGRYDEYYIGPAEELLPQLLA